MAWVTKDSVEQYDHTPKPPKEYTKKEKAQNWWHYHKFIVLGVVVAILVVAWFIKDTVFQTRPDVQIGYIGQYDLPADTVTALQDALTPYCTDLNGDGKVVVQVNSYTVDFNAENDNTDAYNQMAGVTRLSADLSDSGTLYVMGQYRIDPAMGKYIVMYYGSFKRAYRHLDEDELTEEMRKVLRHEFRHHVEGRAGVRDLEVWDAEQIAMYKEQQAENE